MTQPGGRAEQLREMSDELLGEQIRTLREEALRLRFRHATGELENTARMSGARRDLARALTVARQRETATNRESS